MATGMDTSVRKARIISKDEAKYFLECSDETLTSTTFMMENFGEYDDKPPKFHTYDIMLVPENSVRGKNEKYNSKPFYTTVGRYIWNMVFAQNTGAYKILGYINVPVDGDVLDDINDKLSYAVIEDKIPLSVLKSYLMRQQKYQPYSNILCSGFTMKMLNISHKIDVKKKALLKKYEKELKDPIQNMYAADKIEKELLDYAKKELKDDVSMDMYASKARGSFSNNFKNLFVMKGAVKDPDPNKGYDVITSSYIDGLSREDYPNMAKALSVGPYARAKKTQLGGYWEKLFLRAFEHIRLGPKGSDCGTKRTITVTLTKYMEDLMMYSFIVEKDGSLVELNSSNRDKYLDKTVKMRFASLCEYKDPTMICNACIGNLFYKNDITNIGTATPQIASELKNKSLKQFHNSTVQLHEIDVNKAFDV